MTSSQSVFRSVFLYFLLALLFARYSPLYLCLFLFSFAFLSPYLPILVSSLTFLHVFLDSLYVFYFLFSFGRRSPSLHHIFNQNPLFPYYYHFSLISLLLFRIIMGQRCARSVIIILTFLRLKDEKISLYYYCFDRTRLFWPNTQSHL